jgi:hypothetical protein
VSSIASFGTTRRTTGWFSRDALKRKGELDGKGQTVDRRKHPDALVVARQRVLQTLYEPKGYEGD